MKWPNVKSIMYIQDHICIGNNCAEMYCIWRTLFILCLEIKWIKIMNKKKHKIGTVLCWTQAA